MHWPVGGGRETSLSAVQLHAHSQEEIQGESDLWTTVVSCETYYHQFDGSLTVLYAVDTIYDLFKH